MVEIVLEVNGVVTGCDSLILAGDVIVADAVGFPVIVYPEMDFARDIGDCGNLDIDFAELLHIERLQAENPIIVGDIGAGRTFPVSTSELVTVGLHERSRLDLSGVQFRHGQGGYYHGGENVKSFHNAMFSNDR